jgi:asparagine synthase (glutamine-hydrolysing)
LSLALKSLRVSALLLASSESKEEPDVEHILRLMEGREGGGRPVCSKSKVHEGNLVLSCLAKEEGEGHVLVHGHAKPPEPQGSAAPATQHFEGEFVCAWKEGDSLMMARDPMGARPAYWAEDGGLAMACSDEFPLRVMGLCPIPVPPGSTIGLRRGQVKVREKGTEFKPVAFGGTFDEAVDLACDLLSGSFKVRLGRAKDVAIAFSGGLDSSVLASICSKMSKVVLVSVYAEESRDSQRAEAAADWLGLELISKKVDATMALKALQAVERWSSPVTSMDRALSAGFYIASVTARENGLSLLVAGQGADEIFAGYHRHWVVHRSEPTRLPALLAKELLQLERGLRRDEASIAYGGCEASFPYADADLARFALGLPPDYLIEGEVRKRVLRGVAQKIGVPSSLVDAEKKAFQFSSGLQKLLTG